MGTTVTREASMGTLASRALDLSWAPGGKWGGARPPLQLAPPYTQPMDFLPRLVWRLQAPRSPWRVVRTHAPVHAPPQSLAFPTKLVGCVRRASASSRVQKKIGSPGFLWMTGGRCFFPPGLGNFGKEAGLHWRHSASLMGSTLQARLAPQCVVVPFRANAVSGH